MTDTQMKLYGFLRKAQQAHRTFTLEDIAAYTDYRIDSMKTVLFKHFLDVWVFKIDAIHFEVRDFEGVTPRVFAASMCQVTRNSFENETQWRKQLFKLLGLGMQQGFRVEDAALELLDELSRGAGAA